MTTNKAALRAAVNDLIEDPDPSLKVKALDAVYELSRRFPVALKEPMEELQVLIDFRHEDPEGWEKVKALISARRELLDYPPCWPKDEGDSRARDRAAYNAYQRELMASERARSRRASEVENLTRPERDKLRGRAKLDFERKMQSEWSAAKDVILTKAREAHGGRLPRAVSNQIRDSFWEKVDAELDAKEKSARFGRKP